MGQCEDHVQIAGWEKFSSTRSDPAVPGSGLTLRAVAISFEESISRGADQIGHLEWWPGHLLFLRRTAFERQRIQRTRGRMQVTLGEMQIAGRLFQIVMT